MPSKLYMGTTYSGGQMYHGRFRAATTITITAQQNGVCCLCVGKAQGEQHHTIGYRLCISPPSADTNRLHEYIRLNPFARGDIARQQSPSGVRTALSSPISKSLHNWPDLEL